MGAVEDARARAEELEAKVREFFDVVDRVVREAGRVGPVPPPVEQAIEDGMRALRQKWDELWARILEILAHAGSPDALRAAAQGWTAAGNAVGGVATGVAPDRMVTTIEWDGSAAEAYRLVVPGQQDALTSVKTAGLSVASSLNDMADQIENFWIAIAVAIAAAIIGAVTAVAIGWEVVTTPAAIAVVASAIGVAFAAITTAIIQAKLVLDRVDRGMRDTQQNLVNIGTSWPTPSPTAAAALGDASVRDGDASEWRPRS